MTVASMTNGAGTHNEKLHDELLKPDAERNRSVVSQTAEEYAEGKAKEFRKVCSLFGVKEARILDFPDEPFRSTPEAVEAVRDIVYDVRPHVLITQSPYLSGPHGMASGVPNSHTETASAVLEACALAAKPSYATRQRPHTIAATYYPGVYFMQDEIDFYIDISAWIEQRIQAEILFESQGHTEAFARKRVEISAGHMGWYSGTEYAEGFVRAAPELLSEIRVPEVALRSAAEPRMDHIKRISGELMR